MSVRFGGPDGLRVIVGFRRFWAVSGGLEKKLVARLYPALNRHELAGADGEPINIRWEAEMQKASEELRRILRIEQPEVEERPN